MPAPTLSITSEQVYTAMRYFLTAILPPNVEVVQGQDNRVPEPLAGDFVVMTSIMSENLETTVNGYYDGIDYNVPGQLNILHPHKITMQLDIHGPNSSDNKTIIATLFRSDFGVQTFAASGFDIAPLYTEIAQQVPFVNGEQQVETRWVLDAVLQSNPIVQVGQDFAGQLKIGLINVDAKYPPTH